MSFSLTEIEARTITEARTIIHDVHTYYAAQAYRAKYTHGVGGGGAGVRGVGVGVGEGTMQTMKPQVRESALFA